MSDSKSKNKAAFSKVATKLKGIKTQAKDKNTTFTVIYTAPYAEKVHDDLEMPHKNGQAKFLEQPLRENSDRLLQKAKDLVKQGKTLEQALKIVAQELLEISQKLVPVDTGFLRDSGKIKVTKG